MVERTTKALFFSALLSLSGAMIVNDGLRANHRIEQSINQELFAANPDLASLSDDDIRRARGGQAAFARGVDSFLSDYRLGDARETPEGLLRRMQYLAEVDRLEEAQQVLQRMDRRNELREPIAARYGMEYFLRSVELVAGGILVTLGTLGGLYSVALKLATRRRLTVA